MNILVCVKQVPDTTEIKIDPVTNTLIRSGVPSILNPFDAYALELALRLKDADRQNTKVYVMSMGPEQAKAVLKEGLAAGADEAFLVSGRFAAGSDTLATSYILASGIRHLQAKLGVEFDVIFTGKQAIDGDTAQVGPQIAEHLGLGQVTYATEVEQVDDVLRVNQDTDDGYNIVEVKLPCLLSVTKTAYELRYPTIKSKMAAGRATIQVIDQEALGDQLDLERCGLNGSPTFVKKTFTPEMKKGGILITQVNADDAASQLVTLLTDEKIL